MFDDKSNDHDDSSSSSDGGGSDNAGTDRLSAQDGLSLETLQLLWQFQASGGCFMGDGEADDDGGNLLAPETVVSKDTVCVSYTANDSKVIAETYKRLQAKEAQAQVVNLEHRVVSDLLEFVAHPRAITADEDDEASAAAAQQLGQEFKDSGVVRLNQVLDPTLAAACLEGINRALLEPDEDNGAGFGNIFSRENRCDAYQRPTGLYRQALQSMLSKNSSLGQMIDAWLEDEAGVFHEFSALVSDSGAASQPIHPDAPYSELAPLLTVFCALQDVTVDMGPTVFLPRSNSAAVHKSLTSPGDKDRMLAGAEYRQAVMQAGDCAVMDARTLHFGSANTSDTRRVLLYFTIRNPAHGVTDADFPDCGSLFADLHMTTSDFQ